MPVYPRLGIDVGDADAAVGQVISPRTFYSVAPPRKTGTMPTVALNPALNAYPAGYHGGAPSLTVIEADLIKENILAGKTIFGVGGIIVPKVEVSVPALIGGARAESIVTIDQIINRNAPVPSEHKEAYDDQPADLIKRLTPTVASSRAADILAGPDQNIARNAPVARAFDLQIVVGGGIQSPIGGDVDETAAAQSAAINDMNLPPQTPALNDAYLFGFYKVFDVVRLKYDTQGVGDWVITWKYWNGAWVNLAGVTDLTNSFRAAVGTYDISFTRPGDWVLLDVLGYNLYWVKPEITTYTSLTTQPLGSQAWVRIIT